MRSILHLIRAHPVSTGIGILLALAGIFISLPADSGGKFLAFAGAALLLGALPLLYGSRRARVGGAVLGFAGAGLWAFVFATLGIDAFVYYFRSPEVTVNPLSGTHSTAFTGAGEGFSPNGGVEVTATKPDGSRYRGLHSMTADSAGHLEWSWKWESGDPDGKWRVTFKDMKTGKPAYAEFIIQGKEPAPTAARPEVEVSPKAGDRNTHFQGTASGFTPAGSVLITAIQPDGRRYPQEYRKTPDGSGRFTWSWRWDSGDATGRWTIVFDDQGGSHDARVELTIR
ncbi:hypothetical protein [Paractinoplanes lichenicola]|uniref:DUF4190 domain-containing protein n=1 Tax=Paractinoplanes lichenicola TaxID=2802976 RepID=A0ABS1VJ80_9ACTN|nr:hypothetical protein [Actinoplanes lichenicola]MBL7254204.1 hypothetical protein [Actinoplanes lichenicola]